MESLALALLMFTIPVGPPPGQAAPSDGLGLDPAPVSRSAVGPVSVPAPITPPARSPIGAGAGAGLGVVALGFAARDRSRRRRDDEPYYVLVHGDGGSDEDFDELIEAMGVDPLRTIAFDYRTAARGPSSTWSSRRVDTRSAAAALDRLIRAVAVRHSNVYSIHHSRGGAIGVEMIAALDSGERPPISGYRGAALLDPAIASGDLGWLQRLGALAPRIPDNGGFDPIRCDDAGCRDIRAHLGAASGVDVIAIRNPDALITNFIDEPPGLRTLDLVNDGHQTALARWWSIPAFVHRIFEAHSSVRRHPVVAECILAESRRAGSCDWTGASRLPRLWWGRGNTRNVRK
jgi:hypothetical protein